MPIRHYLLNLRTDPDSQLGADNGPSNVSIGLQQSMPSPTAAAYWEGLILLGGFFGIVAWKMFTGEIGLDQLLDGDIRDPNSPDGFSTYVSEGRVQSLIITLFSAGYYLVRVVNNPKAFPALPNELLALLAGSQALYLGGKAQAMLLGRLRDFLK